MIITSLTEGTKASSRTKLGEPDSHCTYWGPLKSTIKGKLMGCTKIRAQNNKESVVFCCFDWVLVQQWMVF